MYRHWIGEHQVVWMKVVNVPSVRMVFPVRGWVLEKFSLILWNTDPGPAIFQETDSKCLVTVVVREKNLFELNSMFPLFLKQFPRKVDEQRIPSILNYSNIYGTNMHEEVAAQSFQFHVRHTSLHSIYLHLLYTRQEKEFYWAMQFLWHSEVNLQGEFLEQDCLSYAPRNKQEVSFVNQIKDHGSTMLVQRAVF
jgi:hypothetical protein